MSDSIKKYHEMVEDGEILKKEKITLFDITEEQKKQAYHLLTEYDDVVIKYAFNKIMFGN
tara:strand:+ start:872 stop:1051 length:180 start_codon:yes stop_codon:yes gene_type:complete